jgi:hypothetical protein
VFYAITRDIPSKKPQGGNESSVIGLAYLVTLRLRDLLPSGYQFFWQVFSWDSFSDNYARIEPSEQTMSPSSTPN